MLDWSGRTELDYLLFGSDHGSVARRVKRFVPAVQRRRLQSVSEFVLRGSPSPPFLHWASRVMQSASHASVLKIAVNNALKEKKRWDAYLSHFSEVYSVMPAVYE